MKRLSFILLFLSLCLNTIARPIDVDEAKAIAMDFLIHQNDGYVNGRMAKRISLTQYVPKTICENSKNISSNTLIYLFNLSYYIIIVFIIFSNILKKNV